MGGTVLLGVHILTGGVALLAGAGAYGFRKGSVRHRRADRLFVVTMLAMAPSGAYIASSMGVILSVIGGTLTLYLVATSWAAAARWHAPRSMEIGTLLAALAIGGVSVVSGFEAIGDTSVLKGGFPPGPYFTFSAVALLGAAGDLRLLVKRSLGTPERVARHLWRISVAFMIASSAFFLGQAQLFPQAVRDAQLLALPVLMPFLLMGYWLVRTLVLRRATAA